MISELFFICAFRLPTSNRRVYLHLFCASVGISSLQMPTKHPCKRPQLRFRWLFYASVDISLLQMPTKHPCKQPQLRFRWLFYASVDISLLQMPTKHPCKQPQLRFRWLFYASVAHYATATQLRFRCPLASALVHGVDV